MFYSLCTASKYSSITPKVGMALVSFFSCLFPLVCRPSRQNMKKSRHILSNPLDKLSTPRIRNWHRFIKITSILLMGYGGVHPFKQQLITIRPSLFRFGQQNCTTVHLDHVDGVLKTCDWRRRVEVEKLPQDSVNYWITFFISASTRAGRSQWRALYEKICSRHPSSKSDLGNGRLIGGT